MEIDETKVDAATLALLLLGLHNGNRAWKGLNWEARDRLHAADLISQPAGKAKWVVLTEKGMALAQAEFDRLFGGAAS